MGRPRIHHTPEEVQAADRAKSKRYYNKYVIVLYLKLMLY
jgi:hypothetical protein